MLCYISHKFFKVKTVHIFVSIGLKWMCFVQVCWTSQISGRSVLHIIAYTLNRSLKIGDGWSFIFLNSIVCLTHTHSFSSLYLHSWRTHTHAQPPFSLFISIFGGHTRPHLSFLYISVFSLQIGDLSYKMFNYPTTLWVTLITSSKAVTTSLLLASLLG